MAKYSRKYYRQILGTAVMVLVIVAALWGNQEERAVEPGAVVKIDPDYPPANDFNLLRLVVAREDPRALKLLEEGLDFSKIEFVSLPNDNGRGCEVKEGLALLAKMDSIPLHHSVLWWLYNNNKPGRIPKSWEAKGKRQGDEYGRIFFAGTEYRLGDSLYMLCLEYMEDPADPRWTWNPPRIESGRFRPRDVFIVSRP